MTSCFDLTVEDKIARITFNRAEKRNSMLPEFWSDFPKAIKQLSDLGEVRCIVLDAQGTHFSAGMDLSVFAAADKFVTNSSTNREHLRNLILSLQDALSVLEKCRIPVIAAVQGGCLGAGLDLASACDIRFATEDAYFCIQEINIGIMADLGTLQRLPHKLPDGIVRELAFTGGKLTATRAHNVGFVNDVFASVEKMNEHVLAVARAIASKPPLVVSSSKECINYSLDNRVADSLMYAANVQSFIFDAEEVAAQIRKNGKSEHSSLKPVSLTL
ncbi:MAG: enoyl-CoA hydratase/isomerase family protein [Candidatus Obscuribacterales bacterium]|nr:enoyl-CoA hydratase/isomerase family protein [Candidatus Obscuribacterales bacterium]